MHYGTIFISCCTVILLQIKNDLRLFLME